MDINRTDTPEGTIILQLGGEMDALGCSHIRSSIEYIANASSEDDVTLDLSNVSFIDSSGIGLIVFLFKRLGQSGRKLEIINVQGQPEELFDLLQMKDAIGM